MSDTPSNMVPLGSLAPNFYLLDTVSQQYKSLANLKGKQATVVMFICNHCPFVQHINNCLANLAVDYQTKDVKFIAISSNDIENYPQDSPVFMKDQALKLNYPFPYLFDETQEIAKAYDAACTPDFFLFNNQNKLVYRGQLDDSRPGNGIPLSGNDLRGAIDGVIYNRIINPDQKPSLGCNIKWKL